MVEALELQRKCIDSTSQTQASSVIHKKQVKYFTYFTQCKCMDCKWSGLPILLGGLQVMVNISFFGAETPELHFFGFYYEFLSAVYFFC